MYEITHLLNELEVIIIARELAIPGGAVLLQELAVSPVNEAQGGFLGIPIKMFGFDIVPDNSGLFLFFLVDMAEMDGFKQVDHP